ncbi:MAG: periplasmic heavy metal sensor [Candidatus Accumulibacter sp.]|nr:periplasmic heavy metal sensor [Accumulibacter sp.]
MKNSHSARLFLAAAALSLGLVAGAQAMPRGEHPGQGMGMGMPGHHAMIHGRAMARLHGELKLDATQDAQWKEAEKFSRDHRATMRERFQKERAGIKAMLDQPGADLRAIAKRMDDLKAEGLKERDAVRERWFAVYDTLNPEQKEKARLFFKAGAERMEQKGKKSRDGEGRRG